MKGATLQWAPCSFCGQAIVTDSLLGTVNVLRSEHFAKLVSWMTKKGNYHKQARNAIVPTTLWHIREESLEIISKTTGALSWIKLDPNVRFKSYSTARQFGLIKGLIRTCKVTVDVGNIGKSNWDVLTTAMICQYWFKYFIETQGIVVPQRIVAFASREFSCFFVFLIPNFFASLIFLIFRNSAV